MIDTLLGVLRDGTPETGDVPETTRRTLRFSLGEDVTLRLVVVRRDGSPLDTDGRTFTWALRRRTDPAPLLAITGTPHAEVPARVDFQLAAADTLSLEPGVYAYDIWTVETSSGAQDPLVPLSTLVIEPSLFPRTE